MSFRQWDIWKCRPAGFESDHWFVLLSNQERLDFDRAHQVNGLACFSLRGTPRVTDVRLNSADGFDSATVCACDFVWVLDKRSLQSRLGRVCWERQQAIKSKLREVLRL